MNDFTAIKVCGFHAQVAQSLLTSLSQGSFLVFVVMAITCSNQRQTRQSHAVHVALDTNASMEAGVNVAKEKLLPVPLQVVYAALDLIICHTVQSVTLQVSHEVCLPCKQRLLCNRNASH
jgi:hypothetical protein